MTVQRTPPQRAHAPPVKTQGSTSVPSPSRAFKPSNPTVLRTPPAGTAAPQLSPVPPTPNPASMEEPHVVDAPMQIDESLPPVMPERALATTPELSPEPTHTAPITPAPKTPKSARKTPAQVLAEPVVPIPLPSGEEADYGKRYDVTMETLDLAVRASAQKWT